MKRSFYEGTVEAWVSEFRLKSLRILQEHFQDTTIIYAITHKHTLRIWETFNNHNLH
jgi:type I site-specific restriction endonuclease